MNLYLILFRLDDVAGFGLMVSGNRTPHWEQIPSESACSTNRLDRCVGLLPTRMSGRGWKRRF